MQIRRNIISATLNIVGLWIIFMSWFWITDYAIFSWQNLGFIGGVTLGDVAIFEAGRQKKKEG